MNIENEIQKITDDECLSEPDKLDALYMLREESTNPDERDRIFEEIQALLESVRSGRFLVLGGWLDWRRQGR